ncbi:exonuclease domain-containing protein [Paenibacillus sp. YPG26]|uniref:exonuclease domain-containing protein n=1 Tax=Paenibacillus sp. YPG26 TaxID=2878915 RepID=UPI00203AEC2C|nr:exonuclease domain-containing protein [Paenibacillus sp. YPG26]USB33980.1 3'-5' exoribonuclease [Paenibacillus sp. YPG26]
MDFVSIDFETANMRNRGSVCAVGIVVVRDGEIAKEFYSLVNPLDDFDPYVVQIHGITADMVEDAPTFKELWDSIAPLLNNQIVVAHNAAFDMSVLRHCMTRHELPSEGFNYLCSYLLAKRIWPGLSSYRLNAISRHLELDAFRHHDALEDARAAALVFIKCMEQAEALLAPELAAHCEYRLGSIQPDYTHITFASTRSSGGSVRASQITPSVTEFDEDHVFYRKNVVFSGTLSSLSRREAMQRVADAGGLPADQVLPGTHYLVVGSKDYVKHQNGTKSSSKIRKAEKLSSTGRKIRILPEEEFITLLSSSCGVPG